MTARILEQLVGDTHSFWPYWRHRPGVFTPGGAAPSPFTLADIDAALASGYFREPYIEMWLDGRRLPATDFTSSRTVARETPAGFADPVKIRALVHDGATMLLRCIDQWHGPTRDMLAALAEEFGRAVEAFSFVTPAGQAGLPLHRDDGDVLIVQVAGSKSWKVHEGPAGGAWHAGRVTSDEQQPAELFHTVLTPGQVLYIPRGFAHQAVGQDGLSAHLSLAVREIGVADLSGRLQDCVVRAADDDAVDAAPLPLSDDEITAAAKTLLETARRQLAGMTPEALVAHARQHRRNGMTVPPTTLSLADLARTWPATEQTEQNGQTGQTGPTGTTAPEGTGRDSDGRHP
ncbi:JmjC domain-containing protein [Streptomyces sp. NPDC091266]|uniref:JmjC domain-containing protein n=1 Tax=Streptomyces sp. NPDC091266 TaxID=3365978 RepID=UPI003812853E